MGGIGGAGAKVKVNGFATETYPRDGLVSINLSPNPAVPGQPIEIEWGTSVPGAVEGTATARVLLGSTVLYESGPVALVSIPHLPLSRASQSCTISPSPADAGGRDLYSFGTTIITLEVTLETDPGGRFLRSGQTSVEIVPETVDASWWNWHVPDWSKPTAETVPWGTTYGVAGSLINRSRTADMSGSLAIHETGDIAPGAISRGSSSVPALAPDAPFYAASQPIIWNKGNLPWVTPGGVQTHFHSRLFSYRCLFSLQDSYGNLYPQTSSNVLTVVVAVSKTKITAGAAAGILTATSFGFVAAAAGAALGIITAITAPALAACGVPTGAAARVAYGIAVDPLFADPLYQVKVLLPEPTSIEGEGHTIGEPMIHSLAALRAIAAVSIVEGRILGAQQAEDDTALGAQRVRRTELLDVASEEAGQALLALAASTAEIAELGAAAIDMVLRQMCLEGLTQFDQSLKDAGVSDDDLASFKALQSPDLLPFVSVPLDELVKNAVVTVAQLVSDSRAAHLGRDALAGGSAA